MKAITKLLLGTASVALLAAPAAAQDDPFANWVTVTDEYLADPDPADWPMWRRTSNHWGYSPLDQINTDNVGGLTMVWSRAMNDGFQEATPIVYDGIMFLPHPGGTIQALDATTGDLIWEYQRQLPEEGLALILTRNVALWGDLVITTTNDSFIVALDARTGQVAWETQIAADPGGNLQTSGPIIANGVAISGRSCLPAGGPEACFVAAHDLTNGEELWRFYTIPQEGEAAAETWGSVPFESRFHVGSWITPSFDPELNLVYVGTSVTNPYSKFYIAGADELDNDFLYQTSTLALDVETGELVWYQQHIRDHWDLDHPFERILVDTAIAPNADEVRWINPSVAPGEERQVLTGIPGKTGIFYSIDRATGEFLWARETIFQNVVTDIDTATGRATMNLDLVPTAVDQQVFVCPSAGGGKDWMAGAYSPLTNAIYYPLQNRCMESITTEENIQLSPSVFAPGADNVGTVRAISVETGEELWRFDNRAGVMSLAATGGGLIFGGDVNRRFRALDQNTGEVLWETILSARVDGFPVTYEVDGRQYVAIPVGASLISGGYVGMTPELRPPAGGNAVFVFALPED